MTKYSTLLVALMLLQIKVFQAYAQPEFKYGLGFGVNLANITETNSYPLYEDIAGNEYHSEYSSMFSNLGSHFMFHGDLWFKKFILGFKPGIYTYKFNKTDEILFNTEPIEQTNAYLLRYFQLPVEFKIPFGYKNLKPFLGGSASYGYLLQQGGKGTHSFIRSRFSVTPIAGAYYSFDSFELALTGGYNFGLHSITHEADRYNTGSTTPYAQSDIKLNDLFISLSILFSVGKQESKGALDCPTPRKGKTKKTKRK